MLKRSLHGASTPIALGVILLAGGVLRAFRLSHPALWYDEYATYMFSSGPVSKLFGAGYKCETNPPLFYLLQHAWLRLGTSPGTMRLLPLALGMAAISLTFVLGKMLFGVKPGLIGAALVASSDLQIMVSREIRAYALMTVAALSSLIFLVSLLGSYGALHAQAQGAPSKTSHRLRAWIGYVGCMTVLLYSHNTAILAPMLATGLITAHLLRGRLPRDFGWRWVMANALVLALFSPWLLVAAQQTQHTMGAFWLSESTPRWVSSQLMGLYPFVKWSKPFMYALLLLGAWLLRKSPWALAFLLTFVLGEPLLLYLASLFRPVFYLRPMIWTIPLACILMAIPIARLCERHGALAGIAGTLLAAGIQLMTTPRFYPAHSEAADATAFLEPLKNFRTSTDLLLVAPASINLQLHYETRQLGDRLGQGFGFNFGDHPHQIESWFGVTRIQRDQLPAHLTGIERVWWVREIQTRFRHAPGEGFEPVARTLDRAGTLRAAWRSGALELVRYDLPTASP